MHSSTMSTVSPKLSKIYVEESSVKRIEQWRLAVVSDTNLVPVSLVFACLHKLGCCQKRKLDSVEIDSELLIETAQKKHEQNLNDFLDT